jgi:integrase
MLKPSDLLICDTVALLNERGGDASDPDYLDSLMQEVIATGMNDDPAAYRDVFWVYRNADDKTSQLLIKRIREGYQKPRLQAETIPYQPPSALEAPHNGALHKVGQIANQAAAQNLMADYRSRKAQNTLRAQDNNLRLFREALLDTGVYVGDLLEPESWRGITWGLVAGFAERLLNQGYAVGSVNLALSTIKAYAKLAHKAGALSRDEYLKIKDVSGYSQKEMNRVNEGRGTTRFTRKTKAGAVKPIKKAEHISLTPAEVRKLKETRLDTPQGRRDRLLMCLLLDHGLRCSEIALLEVTNFNFETGEMTFYRPKVQKEQTHKLSRDTRAALQAYADAGDMPPAGKLLRGSRKGGKLTGSGMSERAITARVNELGRALIGKDGLSAHDGRHSWATRAARNGTDPFALQEAGGWNSLAMPRRYVEAAKIANEGVKLDD